MHVIGAHNLAGKLTFLCENSRSYFRASRLIPGTVGATPRANRALATQFSDPLNSCVPPCTQSVPSGPNSSSVSSASNFPGTDAAYDDLLEPIPSPPLVPCWEKLSSDVNPFSNCEDIQVCREVRDASYGHPLKMRAFETTLAYTLTKR